MESESVAKPKRRHFGEIPGYPVGSWFPDRAALAAAGVHPPTMAGISGGAAEGADSIVLSGGYEDDQDFGDVIVYTGHGGNDPETGAQISDQKLTRQNLALVVSCQEGRPVRVSRGARHRSKYSPVTGFRYDGLYRVDSYWSEAGRSGFLIWRFRIERIVDSENHHLESDPLAVPEGTTSPARRSGTVQRVVRNSAVGLYVKQLHEHQCQVCGIRLEIAGGFYSEAAHIRPLGQPHNGPDVISNVLCLCPNHHLLFDFGGITVTPIFEVVTLAGQQVVGELRRHPRHPIDADQLAYHRSLFDNGGSGQS